MEKIKAIALILYLMINPALADTGDSQQCQHLSDAFVLQFPHITIVDQTIAQSFIAIINDVPPSTHIVASRIIIFDPPAPGLNDLIVFIDKSDCFVSAVQIAPDGVKAILDSIGRSHA